MGGAVSSSARERRNRRHCGLIAKCPVGISPQIVVECVYYGALGRLALWLTRNRLLQETVNELSEVTDFILVHVQLTSPAIILVHEAHIFQNRLRNVEAAVGAIEVHYRSMHVIGYKLDRRSR